MYRRLMPCALACLMLPGLALAAQIHVPGDYLTIQQAMVAATTGDTITVAPGSYQETVDFLGKDVTLQSSGGPQVTTIVAPIGGFGNPGVLFQSGETAAAILEGFTLRDCHVAVVIQGASPTIRNNWFESNWLVGINASGATGLTVERNVFRSGQSDALAIALQDSSGVVRFNAISDHPRGGIFLTGSSSFEVHHNVIKDSGNYGGWAPAIFLYTNAGLWNTIDRNLLLRNHGPAIEAGNAGGQVDARITNNQFIENDYGPHPSVLAAGLNTGTLVFEANLCLGPPLDVGYVSSFIRSDVGTLEVRNCVFARQIDTDVWIWTRALDIADTTLVIEHCTFHEVESGVAKWGGPFCTGLNSILWDVLVNWQPWVGAWIDVQYSDVGPVPFGGGTNISSDPQFVDAAGRDYHLLAGSPCIDAPSGSTALTTDRDGRPRDATPDLGAYEYLTRSHWFSGSGESGSTLQLVAQGPVGESVTLAISAELLAQPVNTNFGLLYLQPPLTVVPLGTIGASGLLRFNVTVPSLALPSVLYTQTRIGPALTLPTETLFGG